MHIFEQLRFKFGFGGPRGLHGIAGPQGPKGDMGLQGFKGQKGEQAQPGLDANVNVVTAKVDHMERIIKFHGLEGKVAL